MREVKKVLFPTDFSDAAEAALADAVRLAEAFGAELHFFHATVLHDYHPRGGEEDFPDSEELLEILAKHSRDLLGKLATRAGSSSLTIKEAVRRGTSPAPLILEYADEEDMDLIVMATHGRRGLGHLWLGSVAEEVARRSSCPVLTVRTGVVAEDRHGVGQILVPVDFSEASDGALAEANRLARLLEANVHLLHVIERPIQPVFYEAFTELAADDDKALGAAARTELEKIVTKTGLDPAATELHVVAGYPAQEIVSFAKTAGMDLIVMGSHGLTGLAHLLLGSVAERVIRQAPCPVLVAKS